MARRNIHNLYDPPKSNTQFSEGHKSKGILDDYAVRQSIAYKEMDLRWDDLRVPAQNTKLNPSKSEPNFESFTDGLFVYKFDSSNADDESIHFVVQLPHAWKEGSAIRPHLHWCGDNANAGNVYWSFEYSCISINGTFPSSTTSEVLDANTGSLQHNIVSFDEIDMTGKKISSMIVCRLTRRSTSQATDTYNGNACFLEFDFHYQTDGTGSQAELTKYT